MDIIKDQVSQALQVLGLDLPVSQAQLELKRKELLHTWDPARYANLTNNPKKYMQSFKEAEEMTKKIEAAYSFLSSYLASTPNHPPDGPVIV
jgi:preprotein translocase subunit Sec63